MIKQNSGINAYTKMGAGAVENASPERIVQALLGGAIDKISIAKGCMDRSEKKKQSELIGKARKIIDSLKASLDLSYGGETTKNTDELYAYMILRLIDADRENDPAILDEVAKLLGEIKSAWDEICEKGYEPVSPEQLAQDNPVK